MPIYHTEKFWDYIINEPEFVIERCKDVLSRSDYDFDDKSYKTSTYYQVVSKLELDNQTYYTLRYPAGLTKSLNEKLNLGIEYHLGNEKQYTEEEVLEVAREVQKFNDKFSIRDYQIEAVTTSLNNFRSLIYSSVGSGKTSMMSLLVKILSDDKILILNNNDFILKQIYERLLSFNIDKISYNPGKEPDYSQRIVIMNTSYSDSKLNSQNENYINFLKEVNTIIWDECQHVQSLTFFEPLFYTDDDKLRHIIGYSGSPFRNQDNPYNNQQDYLTIALLGEPAFSYEMKDTIADGNIAQPYSYFIRYESKPSFIPPQFEDNYFMKYRANITYNKPRNKAGVEMLRYLHNHGIKTLASFNNIKPGLKILETLKEEGINALFIKGQETIYEYLPNKKGKLVLDERNGTPADIKTALEGDYNIILCSKVMDEGVDVDIFQAVVLFSAGKTPIANIQRIGRVSRKKANGANVSFVIDFRDIGGDAMFRSHYEQRKRMMEKCGVKNFERVQDFCEMIENLSKEE